MRQVFSALILLPMVFPQEPGAAQASPFFLHALSESELAENSAGHSIVVHLEDAVRKDQGTARATDIMTDTTMYGRFGIQTFVLDTGASSMTQAATSITLRATLRDFPLPNVSLRPGL